MERPSCTLYATNKAISITTAKRNKLLTPNRVDNCVMRFASFAVGLNIKLSLFVIRQPPQSLQVEIK